MARASGNTMKVDVALPLDIFNTVMKLAENSGAPIHHRSNQRVLSPTILQLIGLGIQSSKNNPELLTASIPMGGRGIDLRVDDLIDRIGKIEDSLSFNALTLDHITEIARDEAHKVTQPIFDNMLEIRTQLSQLKPKPINKSKPVVNAGTDDRIEFGSFKEEHGLNIKRGDPAADIKAALEEAGLTDQYQYDSTVRAFYRKDVQNPVTTFKPLLYMDGDGGDHLLHLYRH